MKGKSFAFVTSWLILFLAIACEKFEEPVSDNKSKWEVYTTENGLASNIVWTIEQDHLGNIWAGTERGICVKDYNNGFKQWFDVKANSIRKFDTELLFATSKGSYSFDFKDSTLNVLNPYYNGHVLDTENHTIDIMKFENTYWTADRILRYFWTDDMSNWDFYKNDFLNYSVNQLMVDDLYLWVSTKRKGLARIGYDIKYYNSSNGLSSNQCNTTYIDSKGNFWVGVDSDKGLCKMLQNDKFECYDFGYIKAITEDKAGNLWLGSSLYGIYKWETNGNITNYTMLDGLPSNRITDILVSINGSIWASTEDAGIVKLNH